MDFVAMHTQYRPKDAKFVGLAIDNSTNVTRFLQRLSVNYPILIGESAAHTLARQPERRAALYDRT